MRTGLRSPRRCARPRGPLGTPPGATQRATWAMMRHVGANVRPDAPTWANLGRFWAQLGPILGPTWVHVGITFERVSNPLRRSLKSAQPGAQISEERHQENEPKHKVPELLNVFQRLSREQRQIYSQHATRMSGHVLGHGFPSEKRPKTLPKPSSTPASIQERFREPPDFDFEAMLGLSWAHVGPMLGPRAPKSSPREAQARSSDGPGAAQERPRAPKRPQGPPRRPPEADFGQKMRPTWAQLEANSGPT